jgi:hypothetical protein
VGDHRPHTTPWQELALAQTTDLAQARARASRRGLLHAAPELLRELGGALPEQAHLVAQTLALVRDVEGREDCDAHGVDDAAGAAHLTHLRVNERGQALHVTRLSARPDGVALPEDLHLNRA